jgi:ribosomal protein S18 acetylase RimI-like enzyme
VLPLLGQNCHKDELVAGALLNRSPLLRADANVPILIARLTERYASDAVALLGELRVSLLSVCSSTLYRALVRDALGGRIDCRVALDESRVVGIVLAAPREYWWRLPLRHASVAGEALRARLVHSRGHSSTPRDDAGTDIPAQLDSRPPSRTWKHPGDAWRIIFVGTAPSARGRGVAAQLYRDLMSDRSLVARVDMGNRPSIRLHRSLGWRLYRDGDVALAVHLRSDVQHGNKR